MRTALVTLCLWVASPAMAALGDEDTSAGYRGICTMPQSCLDTVGCTATPSFGELLLSIEGDVTTLGRNDQDASPIDRYPTLESAFPLPEIETHRRSFLVDLPPEGRTRRFALHVQIIDAQTQEPILRPRSFVLECLEAPA